LVTVGVGYATLQWLGRTYGATRDERSRPLPGDELVDDPLLVTTHAITIDAPPAQIWPWLIQVGWHQGGWYTSRWVDRLLFPANWASAETIIPELQHRTVGDFVPDGPPDSECGFVIEALEPERHLVLRSRSHFPKEWRTRYGAWMDWSWVFVLDDLGGGRTRFLLRTRARVGPRWLAVAYWLTLAPADLVMARQMLRGVKARAERTTGVAGASAPSR
jgi:hypothetical protein